MAKKTQPLPLKPVSFNGNESDFYGSGFDELAYNDAQYNRANDISRLGQQAYQQSQAEAQANGLQAMGNDTVGNGFLGSLVDSAQAGFAGSLGGTSRFLGEFSPVGKETFNSFADTMDSVVRNNTPLEKPEGANYVAGAIGNAIGSGGAAMVEAAIVAGIGKFLGLGAVGAATLKVIEKTPALGRLASATEAMWKSGYGGKIMAGEVFGSPFEAMAEAGNLITEMRQEGFSDDEIRSSALKSAAYNTAWLTVANVLEGKVGMAVNGATKIGSKAGKVAMASLGDAAGEGMEEFGQNLIGNVAKGEDLNFEEAREAALQGAIGGAFLGGGRQAVDSYLINNNQQQEESPVAKEDVAIDRLRNGLAQETQTATEQPTAQEQPVGVPEAPVSNETTQADESVPSMEIMDAISPLTNPVEQEQTDVTQQQETTQEETPIAQQEEQQQKPTQPKPEKAPIVGSATAYKEKGHKWKTIAQAQADLDAIVADVKANGGKYNLNSLTPSIKAKISADLALGKGSKSQATLKQMWNKFYNDVRVAKQEWSGNKKNAPKVEKQPTVKENVVSVKETPTANTVENKPVVQSEIVEQKPVLAEQPIQQQNQLAEPIKDSKIEETVAPVQPVEQPKSSVQEPVEQPKTPVKEPVKESVVTKAKTKFPAKIGTQDYQRPGDNVYSDDWLEEQGLTRDDIAWYGDHEIYARPNGTFTAVKINEDTGGVIGSKDFNTMDEAVKAVENNEVAGKTESKPVKQEVESVPAKQETKPKAKKESKTSKKKKAEPQEKPVEQPKQAEMPKQAEQPKSVEPVETEEEKQQKALEKAESKFDKYSLSNAIKNISNENIKQPLKGLYDDLVSLVNDFENTAIETESLADAIEETNSIIDEFFENHNMPNAKAKFKAEFKKKLEAKENNRKKAKEKESKAKAKELGISPKLAQFLTDNGIKEDSDVAKLLTSPCDITEVGELSSSVIKPEMTWAEAIEKSCTLTDTKEQDIVSLAAMQKFGNDSDECDTLGNYFEYVEQEDNDETDNGIARRTDVADSSSTAENRLVEADGPAERTTSATDERTGTTIAKNQDRKSSSGIADGNAVESVGERERSDSESNETESSTTRDVQQQSENDSRSIGNGTSRNGETEQGVGARVNSVLLHKDDSQETSRASRSGENESAERVEQQNGDTTSQVEIPKGTQTIIEKQADLIKNGEKTIDEIKTTLGRLAKMQNLDENLLFNRLDELVNATENVSNKNKTGENNNGLRSNGEENSTSKGESSNDQVSESQKGFIGSSRQSRKDNVGVSRENSMESDNDSKRKNIKAQATRQQVMLQARNSVQRKSVLTPEEENKYVEKVKELLHAVKVQKYDDGIFVYTLSNGDNVLLDLTTDSASLVKGLSDQERVELAKAANQGELVGVNGFNADEARTEFGDKIVRTIHLTDLVKSDTPTHEVMHFAYDLYATAEEKAVLLRDAVKQLKNELKKQYGSKWQSVYSKMTKQEKIDRCEEIVADGLIEYSANETQGSTIRKIARKIIRALARWANELGVHSKMGIYETVKSGQIYKRHHPQAKAFLESIKSQLVGVYAAEDVGKWELYEQALNMQQQGASEEDIFIATGWFEDKDGKWKTPLQDSKDKIKYNLLKTNGEVIKLKDFYDNKSLHNVYAGTLGNVDVFVGETENKTAYAETDGSSKIVFNKEYFNSANEDEIAEGLFHEIQHIIQKNEGFAVGGNTSSAVKTAELKRNSLQDILATMQKDSQDYVQVKQELDSLNEILNDTKLSQSELEEKCYKLLHGEQESERTAKDGLLGKKFLSENELIGRCLEYAKTSDKYGLLSQNGKTFVEDLLKGKIIEGKNNYHSFSALNFDSFRGKGKDLSEQDLYNAIDVISKGLEKFQEIEENNIIWLHKMMGVGENTIIVTNNIQTSENSKNLKLQASTSNSSTESKLAGAVTTNTPKTIGEKVTSFKNNPSAWISAQWKDIYINWVDKNDIFKDIDKKTEEVIGRKLKQHEKLYGRAQGVTSSANGTADVLIGGGREELVGLNQRLQNTKLKHPNGTMKQILENLKEDKLDSASKKFMEKYGFKDAVEALGSALSWRRLSEMHHLTDEAHKQWEHQKELMDKWQQKKDKFDALREDAFRAIEDGKSVKIDGKVYTSKSAVAKALKMEKSPLAQHHADWLEASRKWSSAHEKWRKAKKQAERHNEPFNAVDPSIAMKEEWKAKCKREQWDVTTAEPSTKLADEPKYELPNNLTIEELEQGIKTIPKQFLNACDDYYDMNDNILCLLEDAGVISKELHTLLNTTYKEYCPLQRDFSDTQGLDEYLNGFAGGSGVANVSNMIKEISKDGSKKNIINPLETTISATMMAARRAERNRVGQKLVKLADVPGMEDVVKRVDPVGYEKDGSPKYPAADPKYSTFTVMENGKKVTYQTSPEYYQAIVGYDPPASNIAYDAMAVFARWLREGATMTPSFIVRNGFRDSVLAGYMTNVGFKPILGTINGIRKLHAKSGKEAERNAMFKAMGFGSMTRERDGEAIYNDLQKQAGKGIDFTNPFDLCRAFKDWFVARNEDVELGTRRELFGLAMDKYEKDFKDGKISYEDVLQLAAETGRFGTTDFTRSGVKGQQVNRLAAFFNANVQGVDLFISGLKNPETRPRMLGFIGTYIAMPCLAIWAANHDKDWWKELDPETKYTNFCVSEYFRVPLPQEAGVFFGGGLMAILDMALDNDPKSMGVWGQAVQSALSPNPIPTAIMPILQWQANYDYFRHKSIVNQRLQKLPDDMQYDNYTSETAKLLGEITGLSPKKIDQVAKDLRGTQGTIGMEVLGDAVAYAIGKERVTPDKDFNEKIFVRDFNVTESKRGRYTNDFYDLWSEANKLKSGGRTNRQQERAIKSLNAAQRVISKLNKEIRAIGDPENTRLTSAQKQEMLAVRREKIKQVAKQATDKYGKYFA